MIPLDGVVRQRKALATPVIDPATALIIAESVLGIETSESTAEGFGHLARGIRSLGFGAVTYTAIPLTLVAAERLSPLFLASEDFSTGFLAHYEQAGLARHDFTIERARAGHVDVMDWCEESARGRLRARQREVIDIARFDYGIHSGLTIPTRSDIHVVAGASIACEERANRFEILKAERLEALRTLVRIFHQRVFDVPAIRRHFYAEFLDRLTDDETKVIRLVIGGHRLKCSVDQCGLSSSRAGNLLSTLYRKLGISNASELAYLVGVHQVDRLL